MWKLSATLFAGLLFAVPALADQAAQPSSSDPRIRYSAYGEHTVYRLDLYLKRVTAIQFSDSEVVESILIGDSASWEVVNLKNGHVLSIKPILPSASTDLTVYTDRRVYTFELHSLGEYSPGVGAPPIFRTIFTYPADKKPAAGSLRPKPEYINASYLVSGRAEFRPMWVQDDGYQTSFFLPANAPRPAIFKVGAKGEEQLINSRTQGSRVIVDGTSDSWVLRIDNRTICVARDSAARRNSRVVAEKAIGGQHAGR